MTADRSEKQINEISPIVNETNIHSVDTIKANKSRVLYVMKNILKDSNSLG